MVNGDPSATDPSARTVLPSKFAVSVPMQLRLAVVRLYTIPIRGTKP